MHITELEALNLMRGAVGKAPVSTLSSANPDVIAAKVRLKQARLELQQRSWWFNTEIGVTLVPDTSDEIIVPGNAMEIRPTNPFEYLVARGSRLYDPVKNTYKIGESVKVDMLIALDFAELPFVAANYIQYDAARKFQADFDGDPARVQDLRNDAELARYNLMEAEQRNRRSNILLTAGPLRLNSGIRPQSRYSHNPIRPGG